jgi:NAD(P)H-dependent flavin oxidoreductase YrpB (nitropropane dioxygenase family)
MGGGATSAGVAGREPEQRRRREQARAQLEALEELNADDGLMYFGQSAGLVDSIKPAGDLVQEIVAEAEEILRSRLPTFL